MKRKLFFILFMFDLVMRINAFGQWQQTNLSNTFSVKSLAVYKEVLFAGTDGSGIFSSSDDGLTWIQNNTGLSNLYVNSINFDTNGLLYAGAKNRLFFSSSDTGDTWTQHNVGGTGTSVSSITTLGSCIFAGEVSDGVFLSLNSGTSWTEVGLCCASVWSLCADSAGYVYAGTNAATVYRSQTPFTTWTKMNNGITTSPVRALITSGSLLVAGTYGAGIFISGDHASSWTATNNGLGDLNVISLAGNGQRIFAGTQTGGIFVSADQGLNWIQANEGLTVFNVTAMTVFNDYVYAGLSNGEIWKRPLAEMTGTDEVPVATDLNIFPNPATDKLYINVREFKNSTVEIFSAEGKFLGLINPYMSQTVIDIGNLKKGVYFLKIKRHNSTEIAKIVKY